MPQPLLSNSDFKSTVLNVKCLDWFCLDILTTVSDYSEQVLRSVHFTVRCAALLACSILVEYEGGSLLDNGR